MLEKDLLLTQNRGTLPHAEKNLKQQAELNTG